MNQKLVAVANPERLVSVTVAADSLGVSVHTIRWWAQRGFIGSNKLGARRLIPESEITRLIEESRKPASKELLAA